MTQRHAHARRAGFTLTEILIVVVIVLIAGALVLPMFDQTDATKLTSAARLLAADLEYAKIESISHGDDPRLVVFDTSTHTYHIAATSDPTTPITGDAGMPYRVTFGSGRGASLGGVTIQSVTVGGDDQLGFGLYGQLDQTTPASITLASAGSTISITLDPVSGEAKIGQIN